MKVTPINRKFGKYAPGDAFDLPDKAAKLFIKVGKLAAAEEPKAAPTYQTRMMTAEQNDRWESRELGASEAHVEVAREADPAPYGYKADGTPRKRPGRPVTE